MTRTAIPVLFMNKVNLISLRPCYFMGKEMATHSSILAWRIPWTEEPDGLQSTRSKRVGHDRATNKHTHTFLYTFAIIRKKVFKKVSQNGSGSNAPYIKPFQEKLGSEVRD